MCIAFKISLKNWCLSFKWLDGLTGTVGPFVHFYCCSSSSTMKTWRHLRGYKRATARSCACFWTWKLTRWPQGRLRQWPGPWHYPRYTCIGPCPCPWRSWWCEHGDHQRSRQFWLVFLSHYPSRGTTRCKRPGRSCRPGTWTWPFGRAWLSRCSLYSECLVCHTFWLKLKIKKLKHAYYQCLV